ncbi:hypothetical protein [Bacillus sp. 1P06AnD]|uniref:hypothetical protein n=1 Tax=Bacillus sp. 1P06AnD TaxID=3132208 RepID=UPI0039A3B1B0
MRKSWIIGSLLIAALFALSACSIETEKEQEKEEKVNWAVRNEYKKDGKVLLSVAPDPYLSAGKPFGYLFHFTAAFDDFKGKELAIHAQHKETGEKINVLPPEKIVEPSQGYSTLGRFTATFAIPKSGLWRYELTLDGRFYADVVLSVKE